MKTKPKKRGSLNEIKILSNILKHLDLKPYDKFDLNYKEDKILLEEKFLNYKGENLAKEFNWDEPKEKELW